MTIGNIKRGFNRLFAVFVVVWVIYCAAVYPLTEQSKADAHFREDMRRCEDRERGQDTSVLNDCVRQSELTWQPDQWGLKNFYSREWPFILIVISGVPLLVYGVAAMSLWVCRGFGANPKTSRE
jgi:hypothetical protein